jgi:hypothetical protein
MPRSRKSKPELQDLIRQYKRVFDHYAEMEYSIPKPRLTPTLGESLVAHLLEEGRIPVDPLEVSKVEFSEAGGDLVIEDMNGALKTAEVKSTAESAFQFFGERDLNADYLVWVHFGAALSPASSDCIEIFVINGEHLRAKKDQLPKSMKVTLSRIKQLFPQNPTRVHLDCL